VQNQNVVAGRECENQLFLNVFTVCTDFHDEPCFLYDTRLHFLVDGQDGGKGAPMSCALIYWGKHYGSFFEVFIRFGAVVNIENLQKMVIGSEDKRQLEFELMGTS
jgi:hypothetical protein